jgi:pyridoxal phosphate enzyme (YggS family)
MSIISENFNKLRSSLPENVRLVAVSKFQPNESILELYNAGQRIFGESKVQELLTKYELLPKDIEWHFIGHLQTNKVKYIIPFISLIHGVDSIKLLQEINKCSQKAGRIVDCLLQVHIAREETKFGFSFDELDEILQSGEIREMENVHISGLMGMASYTDDKEQVRQEFRSLKQYFDKVKNTYFAHDKGFKELSIGMSGDYQIAVEEGSTLVRVGSFIFGERSPTP